MRATLAAVMFATTALTQTTGPQFAIPRRDVLLDETVPIVVSGLTPKTSVTIRVRGGEHDDWTSSAVFVADDNGRIDVTGTAPVRGSYKDVDPMGLFWSVERRRAPDAATAADDDDDAEER